MAECSSGDSPPNHSQPGRGRTAWRDYSPDIGGMGRPRAHGPFRSSAVFVPCRRPRSPTPSFLPLCVSALWVQSCTYISPRHQGPSWRRAGHWQALGFFDLKEHFVAIGLACCRLLGFWRKAARRRDHASRIALTRSLLFIVWWGFLTVTCKHIMASVMTSSTSFHRFAFRVR